MASTVNQYVCGDFCELCGDCIVCYGEDECYGGSE